MSKPERGSFAARQRMMRLMVSLAMQAALVLVLLFAGAFAGGDARWLYFWAAIVPLGFAGVYVLAYQRGERARSSGVWTPQWEKSETRRNYALLGVVGVVWLAGAVALFALS